MRQIAIAALFFACSRRETPAPLVARDCEALVDRYTELALAESVPDASRETQEAQKAQVRALAAASDQMAHCEREIGREAYACAMAARDVDAFERCLAR